MPLVALQTNIGEQQILTASRNNYYIKSESGTLFPFTKEQLRHYVEALIETLLNKRNLMIGQISLTQGTANDSALIMDLSSILFHRAVSRIYMNNTEFHITLTSSPGLYYSYEKEDFYEQLMADALSDPDLEQIVALNTKEVVKAFSVLEEKTDVILKQIGNHNPERAAEVRHILEGGFDQPIVRKLWPKLERITAYGSGELREYTARMKRYSGDVPHNHGYYYSEVSLLGKAVEDDSELFEMDTRNTYFELLPVNASDDTTTITPDEAEPNKPYQLVVTNQAGLYRYVSDHFIYIKNIIFDRIQYTIY